MTGPPPGGPAGPRGPATGRVRRHPGRAAAGVLAALLVVLLVGLALAVVAVSVPPTDRPALDPGSVDPDGSRALAQVLRARGVDVVATRRFADVRSRVEDAPGGSTVLVVAPEHLTPDVRDDLDELDADLVLVAPDRWVLDDLGRPLDAAPAAPAGPRPPGCADPAARAAGDLDWAGLVYRPADVEPPSAEWCYPDPGGSGPAGRLVSWSEGARRVVLLGSPEPLRNDAVLRDGNAALALGVLGAQGTLLWWRVDPLDPALADDGGYGDGPAAPGLAPPWVPFVLVWLLVIGLLAVVWRGRRMGRLVGEPLPVLVRSTETAQGRAALYRQAGARDRAAVILRADAVRRAALRLGLPASTPAADVVARVAARAGPDAAAVREVLAGPPPADAAALTRLADALDHLVDEPPPAGTGPPGRARESTP